MDRNHLKLQMESTPPLQHRTALQEDPLISLWINQGLVKKEAHILAHLALTENIKIVLMYF